MRNDLLVIRSPCGCALKTALLWSLAAFSATSGAAAQASVRSLPNQPIRAADMGQQTVQPAGVSAPTVIQPAGSSVTPPSIKPSGTPGVAAPKLAAPDENDTDVQRIAKLEATAMTNARKGSAAERLAARTAWLLGLLFLHGEHAPVDRSLAQKWFERARALQEPLAGAGLAWCQIDGCSGPPAPTAARQYLSPQLRRANLGLMLFLEWKIQDRLAPIQGPTTSSQAHADPGVARMQLLQQAAQAGNASALNELGLNNVTESHYSQALAQFEAGAARSPAAAANATLLRNRLGQKDQSGTPSRSPEELYQQARRYHRGDGVPSNYTEAIRLYQLAASAGQSAARRMLELIYSRPAPGGSVNVAWMRQLAQMDVTAEGAILSLSAPATPLLFVRDATPLLELIPPEWRKEKGGAPR